MKMLLVSMLFLTLNAFAAQSSDEPRVNFDGTLVSISETCLTADGDNLRTQEAVNVVKTYSVDGKTHSVYVGKKVLETSLTYVAQGECLMPGPKFGMCHKRAPSTIETYPLSGNFDVYNMERIGDKISVRRFVKTVNFSVESCN